MKFRRIMKIYKIIKFRFQLLKMKLNKIIVKFYKIKEKFKIQINNQKSYKMI